MLVLKNKINSYCCQRLICALISILILSSQDPAAHVFSPQEYTTATYQYITNNAVRHTNTIFTLGVFHVLHYAHQTCKVSNIYFDFAFQV